jgi:putative spermidine/putrescine transport system ATP-binding protein
MSDRVAVFNDGAIQQIDAVERLYETPANRFVAGFVGDSTLLSGSVDRADAQGCVLALPTGERLAGVNVNAVKPGETVVASVRPERIEALFASPGQTANVLPAAVNDVIYFGDHLRLRCVVAGQAEATVKLPLAAGAAPAAGQNLWLRFPPPHLRIYA